MFLGHRSSDLKNYWLEHDSFEATILPNLASTIQKSKETLQLLDIMEEARDLCLEEWNFRNIVQTHLHSLFLQQKIYWQQRGTIKWVKFGDECTKIFHASTTIRHRKNTITLLRDESGQEIQDHEAKANLLWASLKERMGVTEFTHMYFDLDDILIADSDLEELEREFTKQEIDQIIVELPNNISGGRMASMENFSRKTGPSSHMTSMTSAKGSLIGIFVSKALIAHTSLWSPKMTAQSL